MTRAEWLAANAEAIAARVRGLHELPDGVVHRRPHSQHDLVVRKEGPRLFLIFHGEEGAEIQSRFDLSDPLKLLSPYTQGMMLALLWVGEPRRVYVVGFGGGRVPMLLHHYYPDLTIESTEVDRDVLEVAEQFFGVATDARLRVTFQDGREYLAGRGSGARYDIIMVDAFHGVGHGPYHLATREFYELSRQHLAEGGVLVVNLLRGDFLFDEKVETLRACFPAVYAFDSRETGVRVVIASMAPGPGPEERDRRARALAATHQFAFPFVENAQSLRALPARPTRPGTVPRPLVLTDAAAPHAE